jgi:vacuolar-type H+-ATPase subunit E/Vma4
MIEVVVVDSSGREVYDISVRSNRMSEKEAFSILSSSDPRSAYERWIIERSNIESNHDHTNSLQRRVQNHLQSLDEKISNVDKDHDVVWRRE